MQSSRRSPKDDCPQVNGNHGEQQQSLLQPQPSCALKTRFAHTASASAREADGWSIGRRGRGSVGRFCPKSGIGGAPPSRFPPAAVPGAPTHGASSTTPTTGYAATARTTPRRSCTPCTRASPIYFRSTSCSNTSGLASRKNVLAWPRTWDAPPGGLVERFVATSSCGRRSSTTLAGPLQWVAPTLGKELHPSRARVARGRKRWALRDGDVLPVDREEEEGLASRSHSSISW